LSVGDQAVQAGLQVQGAVISAADRAAGSKHGFVGNEIDSSVAAAGLADVPPGSGGEYAAGAGIGKADKDILAGVEGDRAASIK